MDAQSNSTKDLEKLLDENVQIKTELEYFKYHDTETTVLNKSALSKELRNNDNTVIFLLNMDNFSNINSLYGYEIGSKVLLETAKFLKIVKPNDYELYRFYADKFVLLSKNKHTTEDVTATAQTILSFFNAANILFDNDIEVQISFSIGISFATGIVALTQAELALKAIRKLRGNYYYIYDNSLENLALEKENVYWIHKIKESILDENLIVHYQPILNNATQKIEKYECLSRIYDDGKLVSPFSFMHAASSTRVLHLMTQYVIEQACKKFADTQYDFSINITKDDLFMDYLEEYLLKYTKKYNIETSRIVLELLEDISTLNEPNMIRQLESIKKCGFKIAIDDFGAQNSNFSRLLEFKPDYLKIDGAFIKNIAVDTNSKLIVETIVYICRKSDIKVIAEYVHNKKVKEIVEHIGIDYSQGYYIGEPSTDII